MEPRAGLVYICFMSLSNVVPWSTTIVWYLCCILCNRRQRV